MDSTFFYALMLTALAGLATTIGSIIALFYREPSPKYMAFIMGFSAGVMIYISFVELLQTGIKSVGFIYANLAFFSGMAVLFLIDISLPHIYMLEECDTDNSSQSRLKKVSVFMVLGIAIHNFPEGMATFVGAIKDINIGISLATAIAIHNIPEGIAVSAPIFASTRNARKAFLWSFLSGISEPVGALIAGLILLPFINDFILGLMLSAVGGMMIFISFDELLPVSQSYGKEHISIIGVIVGMVVMSLSLALF